jgi:Tol biopolymer transport system component/predicted Ser/Thr protein kinase
MSLAPGTRLGPYEILAAIGAGGMGEVYRARDTRLDRTVAIKILPSHLATDPALRERFEREARLVSSLNHTHICAVYDIGQQYGTDFLVMEHIEGETLAARLTRGALPTDQALRFATQIADALDKAHRQGVVHRDLKPGNIMITKTGAKLLDFGLAKLRPADPAGAVPSSSALLTQRADLTAEGSIVGTLQYMAPEQLEGKEADSRTDIFSFGAVLYETITGKRAFEGKSQASLIAAILEHEPQPVSALRPMTPPALDRLVKTCLAKDPDERWQSAHDLMNELKWVAEGGSQAGIPAPVARRRKSRETIWMTATLLLALALGVATFRPRQPAIQSRAIRASVLPPEGAILTPTGVAAGPVEVSPDGLHLAFVAAGPDGKHLLWVRPLDATAARSLAGTEEARRPFWSPDGRSLGFFSKGKLRKIDIAGGPAVTLCDAPDGRGGTWNRDGVIVFAPESVGPLFRVSSAGGGTSAVTESPASDKDVTHRYPFFLPDGHHFLYLERIVATPIAQETAIYAGSLESKERTLLVRGATNPVYASGHLLFARASTLMAQRFDPDGLELVGDGFPLVDGLLIDQRFGRAIFSASANEILAYQTGSASGETQLIWFDRTGRQLGVVGDPAAYSTPVLSPDGKRLGVTMIDPENTTVDNWIYDLARNVRTRLTFDPAAAVISLWSPDGSRIAYSSLRKNHFDIYLKAASGVGAEECLLESGANKFVASWSPDGKYLAYVEANPNTTSNNDIWILPMTGDRKPRPLLATPFDDENPRFSPDGRWMAYVSDESGRKAVYVAPFPVPNGKWQVSAAGGEEPKWTQGGKEIVYIAPGNKLMAARVSATGNGFEILDVNPLFEIRPSPELGTKYDMTSDGQRFLVNTAPAGSTFSPITMVVNWTAELKK